MPVPLSSTMMAICIGTRESSARRTSRSLPSSLMVKSVASRSTTGPPFSSRAVTKTVLVRSWRGASGVGRASQDPGSKERPRRPCTDSAKSDRGIIRLPRLSIGLLPGVLTGRRTPSGDRFWSALRNAGKGALEARNPGRSLIYDDRSNYCFRRVLVKRIGMGIVGAGFVGPHHIDAVRRLGFVDVVAIAGSSDATARAKADSLGVPKAYGSYDALLNDPDVQVVHNATPNYLHYPVNAAAIAKGKHVVSDKPLAMTAAEAKKLVEQATKARDRPRRHVQLSRQPARAAGAARDRARGHRQAALPRRPLPAGLAAQGHRLLVAARARQGRRLVGARRHRLALVRPGAAHQRPAHHRGARRHHDRDSEAQAAEGIARGVCRRRRQRGVRARRHQGRGPGVGDAALRQRRARQPSRSVRSAPGTRTISSSRSAARSHRSAGARSTRTSSGSASATRRTRFCRRILGSSTPKSAATRTCRADTRNPGRTRSAT